jgi:hypothetical protein
MVTHSTQGVARYKCALVAPSVDNITLLTHTNPWEQEASLFSLLNAFLTFPWPVIAVVSIPYFCVDYLGSSNGSTFCRCWYLKEWLPSFLQQFKGRWQISKCSPLCFCVSCLGTHLSHFIGGTVKNRWVATLSNHPSVIQYLSADSCQQHMRMLMPVVLHQLCMYIVVYAISSAAKTINTQMKCFRYFLTHPCIQHNFGKMW